MQSVEAHGGGHKSCMPEWDRFNACMRIRVTSNRRGYRYLPIAELTPLLWIELQ